MVVWAIGCGSSSADRTTAACERIWDATCAKLVECRVIGPTGSPVTAQICTQARANGIATCVKDEGAGIGAATDAQVDACVQGFVDFSCTDLCNQVPMDPPACAVIDPSPGTDTFTCQP
jgi:hypothetical protein